MVFLWAKRRGAVPLHPLDPLLKLQVYRPPQVLVIAPITRHLVALARNGQLPRMTRAAPTAEVFTSNEEIGLGASEVYLCPSQYRNIAHAFRSVAPAPSLTNDT